MSRKLKTLISIAGSDPTGGAGIQADVRAGSAMGVHVLSAITALTAQNSNGIRKIELVSPQMLQAQLRSIIEEVIPDSVKIGMIGSVKNLGIIVDFISALPKGTPVVVDPVLKSTAGDNSLFDDDNREMIKIYKEKLFPIVTVVTPNIPELEILGDITELCQAIVIKGGHSSRDVIEDILLFKDSKVSHSHPRMKCGNLHGTGCVYSSILASYLALGRSLEDAFVSTCSKMEEIISNSCDYSLGSSDYGPLNINNYL